MGTLGDKLATYTTDAELSHFFTNEAGYIFVSSYGAKGDGATDDTQAVQNAVNAAQEANKKEVHFVGGKTYLVNTLTNTNGITFVGDNVTITGTSGITVNSFSLHLAESANKFSILGEYFITPNDDPQTIIDSVPSGSKITFTAGVHEHGLTYNNSMIYIDKPLNINIPETAILKVADNSMSVNKHAELIKNFHAYNPITGLLIDSSGYLLGETVRTYEILIDGTGTPNTFKYQVRDFNNNVVQDWVGGIAITGSYQALANGITIQFPQTTGYTSGAGCIVAVGSEGYYVIRVGMGTQALIDGIEINGKGEIDQNQTNNAYSNLYALWLNCGLLINGAVKNFKLEDKLKFNDCNRSIVVLGENVGGSFNLDGTVTGGTSYDVDTIIITNTITKDTCISGLLFGMPEHRGYIKNLICAENEVHCQKTAIEPNNLLTDYSIHNNRIFTPEIPIHCWRYSNHGKISNNIAFGGTGDIVEIAAPIGWIQPTNITHYNNSRISDILGNGNYYDTGKDNIINNGNNNVIIGGETNTIDNGDGNSIIAGTNNQINNVSYSIASGLGNIVEHGVSRINGKEGKTKFNYSDVYSSGKFNTEGDNQESKVLQKIITTDATPTVLSLDGTNIYTNSNVLPLPINSTWGYKIKVVCRDSTGNNRGFWEATGIISRGSGTPIIEGNSVVKIYSSNASWNVEVIVSSSYNALVVRVTGDVSITIRWIAKIELLEVEY